MGPKLTQAEGFVLGVGAKIFTIAGPVILFGVVYGLIGLPIKFVPSHHRKMVIERCFFHYFTIYYKK